jgi:hypothetical protein
VGFADLAALLSARRETEALAKPATMSELVNED